MRIGVLKEIMDGESRVGLTPDGARALTGAGHEVVVESRAGMECGFLDEDYADAGARIGDAARAWDCDLVIKVKEPQPSEYRYLRGQLLIGFLHLAGVERALTEALLDSRTAAVAYETVEDERGRFPLLAPMSALAGSIAPLMGAYHLARFNQGRGTLLGKVLGKRHGNVVIVGEGVVGEHAARVACGMGATVTMFGLSKQRGAELRAAIGDGFAFFESTPQRMAQHVREADLVVGAVLVGGARAPRVVSEAMVRSMPEGSVVVDVSIDQGGCVETARPTTHSDPVYILYGVIHYCVSNIPGAYPRTATLALTAATLPYIMRLAAGGISALAGDARFARGVNTFQGFITHRAVAEAVGLTDRYRRFEELLRSR